MKARKDDLEGEFIDYLARLLPKPELVRLFREVVLDVWKQKEASNIAMAGGLKQRLEEITNKIEKLEEGYAYKTLAIDSETYTRLLDKLRQERLLVEMERRKTETDGYNIETLLQFAEHLLTNAAEMWLKADLGQRQRLQRALFPSGVTFLDGKFGTTLTCPLFNVLRQAEGESNKMASPRGFEPRFSP